MYTVNHKNKCHVFYGSLCIIGIMTCATSAFMRLVVDLSVFWCSGSRRRASGTWSLDSSLTTDRAPWRGSFSRAKVSVSRWSVTTSAIYSGRSTWKCWGTHTQRYTAAEYRTIGVTIQVEQSGLCRVDHVPRILNSPVCLWTLFHRTHCHPFADCSPFLFSRFADLLMNSDHKPKTRSLWPSLLAFTADHHRPWAACVVVQYLCEHIAS